MADRDGQIAAFLERAGWGGAARGVLAADASFRRYDRIVEGDRRAVLMDAPPDKEDVGPFLRIARHLVAMGYSAPAILADDAAAGLVLLEDLGDDTYTRLLAAGADEAALYRLATDVLIDLHARPSAEAIPAGAPLYDDALLLDEAVLLVDWYLPAVGVEPGNAVRESYLDCWRSLLARARGVPETLVLRDFHVDNLIRISGRDGIAACGLLDFQDAVAGPVTYDLVSLLEDARRDIAETLADEMTARYLAAFPGLDRSDFEVSATALAAQRHCKVIGIFTRLRDRDGKPDYLRHIPRLWRLLERAAGHEDLAPLTAWLDAHIPPVQRIIPPERPVR